MSSKVGSTFVTLLMSVPLAAVGLMAVFGVPPLSSVIAATRGLNDAGRGSNDRDRADRKSSENQFEDWDSGSAPEWNLDGTKIDPTEGLDEVDPLDIPGENGSKDDGRGRVSPWKNRGRSNPDRERNQSPDSDDNSSEKLAGSRSLLPGDNGSRDGNSRWGSEPSSRSMSMKESLKKLNALGVKHYHLERGSDADTWLFVCLFAPGDEARVTHRFESESDDPDRAAEETVKQIDGWLLKRFRDKQPITQNAM